ncbi:hypothetical protein [Sporosarcina sp. Te-1]|uniref:hypothetical protein n=1 Tax=Sporosarcina sp. Te-1 TaxID=2818390 RepID=UPI001A9E9D62|nr:hypothetical protein [Sporosarcina sp. Te-1]QTD42617.1 hypothetical protein J3U78_07395 [Sporosarcina sp. Te-1]
MQQFETTGKTDDQRKKIGQLLRTANARLIHMQLDAGEEVAEHDSPDEVIILVPTGKVQFNVEGEEIVVDRKSVLQIAPKERHSLLALENAEVFVFQITP